MSASDALSALKTLYDIVNKVKDNKDELFRISRRIEHIVITIDDSRNRDIIRSDEYNDALTAIFDLITRTQRVAQRLLKRNLGDLTWNAGEISSELRRLNDDVQNYLSVHTVRALDLIHTSNVEHQSVLANNMEEIMVKVAELDYFMRTCTGDGWAPSINSQAQTIFTTVQSPETQDIPSPLASPVARELKLSFSASPTPPLPQDGTGSRSTLVPISQNKICTNEHQDGVDFEGLIQSGKITVKITGLRKNADHEYLTTLNLRLKANCVTHDEMMHAIEDAGFETPTELYEEPKLRILVTEGNSVYDATIPGGLKVNKSEPLLWWWNKYTAYHGLTPATTPRHTIAQLMNNPASVVAGEVLFRFHRTLRVPEGKINNLPASLGTFPLIPVDSHSRGVPPAVRERAGFLIPMFRREAIWLEFEHSEMYKVGAGPAVKISVGGVNALSGVSTRSIEAPKFGAEQDYVVVGQQPWLDGIVSGPGDVRQFVAADLGSGYTVEEQVTGKAEIGGFQFDIFPRRPEVDGKFLRGAAGPLDSILSPSELGMVVDDQLVLERPRESTEVDWFSRNGWSLSDYQRRVSPTATIEAFYQVRSLFEVHNIMITGGTFVNTQNINVHNFAAGGEIAQRTYHDILGLAAGGKIAQKIYRDKSSPRVYDQERGHRFYVHIVTPELWETVTGVLPPITPITRDMYIQNGVNWYKLFDDYVDGITAVSEALSNVLSITQLDEQTSASSAESRLPDLIDPDAPPGCSVHPGFTSSCVFRPCSHVACANCLGSAMLAGSKCTKCHARIEKFVGMQTPLPVISQNAMNANQEGEWTVQETEKLAATAAGSDTVIVIHPLEDRPSPLWKYIRTPRGGVDVSKNWWRR